MDNINGEMRNRTEIDNNIQRMDMEPKGNEYKDIREKKVENDTNIERLVHCNIQEQKLKDKTAYSTIWQIKLTQSPDKRSVSVSTGIRQSKNISVKDKIMRWNINSKQNINQRVEMVDKENRGQPTKFIDQQDNNLHVNNRHITTGLGSNTDIRELDRTYTTRLLERKGSRNDKQLQRNKSYLLRATPFRASPQEDARSGSLDTFRQHNCSLRYWKVESEGIPDRKNKAGILSSEKTLTTNRNNPHPSKTELNNRLIFETMQIRRLHTERRNDLNGLQDMELHTSDRHICNTVQQTNQQLCYSGSQ
ncbi:MAG: hypothetical protein EZS28_033998 [Streblomastix strix]|uniref:Uncharacterized protein n=1 Tax=Streblomastix strix TaxID=222440 RepID=A0A5J4UL80_9EUKA|nr:MAG: hypothetical protein EZS28_033998 [Streblomastix strix]